LTCWIKVSKQKTAIKINIFYHALGTGINEVKKAELTPIMPNLMVERRGQFLVLIPLLTSFYRF